MWKVGNRTAAAFVKAPALHLVQAWQFVWSFLGMPFEDCP